MDNAEKKMSIVLELRKFIAPEYVFGIGARTLAARYATNLHARKVLVVTDPGVLKAGWADDVTETLRTANIPFEIFSDVSCNPKDHEVMRGAELFADTRCDSIIAVGGGSPIDCAKGIGIVSSNKKNILSFRGVDKIEKPIPPLICIPTTAGASADVSQFAIITDTDRMVKIAIVSKALVPDVSLIDPLTLTSMPSELTAQTGMDALVHAFEAVASNANSASTDLFGFEAIRLITESLAKAIEKPLDPEHRAKTMLGSLYAGLAFSNASLGAVHAMAHSLGGLLDLAHGECNALLLQHVVDFNYTSIPDRYEKIAEAMGLAVSGLPDHEKKQRLVQAIGKLVIDLGLGIRLSKLGVRKEDLPALAEKAMKDPCMATNPRIPSHHDLIRLYEQAL